MPAVYYVYILASEAHELYIGVTNDLVRRLAEHCSDQDPESYSSRHATKRLVHFETTTDVLSALRREKQLKRWRRLRKLQLIEQENPAWRDLSEGWSERGIMVPSRPKSGRSG